VVRNRGWRNSLERGDLAAIHLAAGGDSLVNHEPRLVAQAFEIRSICSQFLKQPSDVSYREDTHPKFRKTGEI